jgi:predicted dehydrogenase
MTKTLPPKVRLAIIGAGGISGAHARGVLVHSDRIECVALCDVSDDNLQARNKQLGGNCRLYHDWKVMLAELGDEVEAVDICLPHHLHGVAIIDAARAGKDVLCEKPLCTTLEEADRILEVVKSTGILYQSAHNQLFMPCVREAKKRIVAGDIGEVRWLRSQDCFVANPSGFAGKWRADVKTQGGGELIDTGYHPTYRLLYLAGAEVAGVRASMGRFMQPIGGEDTAMVQVRFANGALGEILTSWAMTNPFGSQQIHVVGSEGQLFGSAEDLWLLPRGSKEPAKWEFPEVDTFSAQLEDFATRVRSRERPVHSVEEGKQVLEVIVQATQDAEGWQQLPRFAEAP